MQKGKDKIKCKYFERQEEVFSQLAGAINKSKSVEEKEKLAQEYLEEIEVLFNCPVFDGSSSDCIRCRAEAEVRKKSVELIQKAIGVFKVKK